MKKEPIVIIAAITTVIEACIACAVGFGLDWTAEQVSLVMAVVIGLGGLVSAIMQRARVTPIKTQ